MRGTVDVVTSLCADEMTGVSPTSTSESKVCKARPGQSARTHAQRQSRCEEKAKYPKSAEGRRYGPSDPYPIGAAT